MHHFCHKESAIGQADIYQIIPVIYLNATLGTCCEGQHKRPWEFEREMDAAKTTLLNELIAKMQRSRAVGGGAQDEGALVWWVIQAVEVLMDMHQEQEFSSTKGKDPFLAFYRRTSWSCLWVASERRRKIDDSVSHFALCQIITSQWLLSLKAVLFYRRAGNIFPGD